jgi:2',3'-cyclic-nucleotide 2'-phosphodiesterase (5'-nucleotidase family)
VRRTPVLLTLWMAAAVLAGCTHPPAPASPGPSTSVSASTAAPPAGAGRGEAVVTVFHETHTHGALLDQDFQSTAGVVRAQGRTFAHQVGLLDAQRRRLPAGHSLFVGNGDDLTDELLVPEVLGGGSIRTEGRHVVEAFNAARLGADTFGYDELNLGSEQLGELLAQSRFAWVSANARDGNRPGEVVAADRGARRWVIRQVGGVRFGITGLVSRDIRPGDGGHAAAVAPAVTLVDPVQAMREVVPQLRAAGAQVVLVLSHLFYEEMERVAREVDGVDVMVGSHLGPQPAGFLDEPRVVEGTILSVAGDNMMGLGQLELTVSDGRIVRHRFQRHVSMPTGPTAPAVKAVLERYLAGR